jgi:hypothetical protein
MKKEIEYKLKQEWSSQFTLTQQQVKQLIIAKLERGMKAAQAVKARDSNIVAG